MADHSWKFMEWSPQDAVHIATIDQAHQNYFGIANQLHEAMLLGHGKEVLESSLAALRRGAFSHFAEEERVMADLRYPESGAHGVEHDAFRQRYLAFAERFSHGEPPLTIELMQFVSTNVRQHHRTSDRMLGEYVKAEQTFAAYMERLLRGDHKACSTILRALLDEGATVKHLYVQVLQRSLYEIGALWQQNKMSVATEHLASTVTERMIGLITASSASAGSAGKAIVTCVADENHRIGPLMVACVFESHGWETHFLGADTPTDALLDLVEQEEPQVLGLSVTLVSHIGMFKKTVQRVRSKFPKLDILAGGQGLRYMTADPLDPHLEYVRSLDELDLWIASR